MKVLCLGDVVGEPGRKALQARLRVLRQSHSIDLVIANGENAAGGLGIDSKTAGEIRAAGADIITLGDHTWQKKEFRPYLAENTSFCIRPANYPEGAPGAGWTVWQSREGVKVGVMNLIGRIFFNLVLDCPFRKAEALLAAAPADVKIIFCDMHAEATSEKMAMGNYLDGKVSCVYGTHTHVQTADSRVLPGGTAYQTDLGMCGSRDSVIGMDCATAIERFRSGLPQSYKIGAGVSMLNGIVVEVEAQSGKAVSIERVWEELG